VLDTKVVFGPYSKYHVVAMPLGFTVPETTAEVGRIDVAAPVVTVGGVGAALAIAASMPAERVITAARRTRTRLIMLANLMWLRGPK
jgi:hypothetical protein